MILSTIKIISKSTTIYLQYGEVRVLKINTVFITSTLLLLSTFYDLRFF